jgi:hypothetical protein
MRATSRHPDVITVVLAVVTAGGFAAVVPGGDAELFRDTGAAMIGPRFFDAFSVPGLQIGPVYLAVLGALTKLLDLAGSPMVTRVVLCAGQAALILWCALRLVSRSARRAGVPDLGARWAVGLLLAVGGFVAEATGNGHPEEMLVGLLLAHAALWAADGHGALAGLVVGLAGGLKQWAAFGGSVLLLDRRWRGVAAGIGVVLVVATVSYAPFFLFGTVHTYDFRWGFDQRSVLGRLGAQWGLSDWALRVIQGAAAGLAAALVAGRRRHTALTAVVVAIAVRLLLDPLRLTYYSGPLVAVLAAWAWTCDRPSVVRWRLPATLVAPLLVVAPYVLPRDATWAAGTLLLVIALAVVLAAGRTRAPEAAEPAQAT